MTATVNPLDNGSVRVSIVGVSLMEISRADCEDLLAALLDFLTAEEPVSPPVEPWEPTTTPVVTVDENAPEEPAGGARCVHCGVSIVRDTTAPLGWRHEASRFQLCEPQNPQNLDRATP